MLPSIKRLFTVWWISAVLLIISSFLYYVGVKTFNKLIVHNLSFILELLIVLVVISSFVQFWIKKWYWGLLQIGLVLLVLLFIGLELMFYPYDYYADELEIPKDVEFELPIDFSTNYDSTLSIDNGKSTFFLVKNGQPGLYECYVKMNLEQSGSVYLKAFEITSNDRLSKSRLTETSKIYMNAKEEIIHKRDITIYEGDFGKAYGARFEVWFDPDNGNADYIIMQKNYIIEGWMR